MSLISTPAILLRSFAYGDTSTILKFYTRELGVTGVMARGARSRQSRGQGGIGTFAEGILSLYVKANRDLQTLKEFAPTAVRRKIAADVTRFAAASVLAEVVLRHAGEESNAPLYHRLGAALDRLGETATEHVVVDFLAEAWGIVDGLGYRPELALCVACGRPLSVAEMGRFDFSAGGIRCGDCDEAGAGPRIGGGARAQLSALVEGERPEDFRRARAHVKLLSDFVTYHVSEGRPLQSMSFLFDLVPRTDA